MCDIVYVYFQKTDPPSVQIPKFHIFHVRIISKSLRQSVGRAPKSLVDRVWFSAGMSWAPEKTG